jgi:hypothetical protein
VLSLDSLGNRKVSLADLVDSDLDSENKFFAGGEYTIKAPDCAENNYGEMTTVIDRAYEFIIRRESTTTRELADNLGISELQVEKMVEVLENSQLIKLKYSLVPNGRIEVLVAERKDPASALPSFDERTKIQKESFLGEIGKLEGTVSSLEHYLAMWLANIEESTKNSGASKDALETIKEDATNLEQNLEKAEKSVAKRMNSLKRKLSAIRVSANSKFQGKRGKGNSGISWLNGKINF